MLLNHALLHSHQDNNEEALYHDELLHFHTHGLEEIQYRIVLFANSF